LKQAHYDLVILGSGSTAFAAALRAQALGKTSVMTEERTTGGTCVNRGCLPSKNLIEAAKIIHDALHPRYRGLSPAEVKLNFRELIAQKDARTARRETFNQHRPSAQLRQDRDRKSRGRSRQTRPGARG
jgi:pyruvate/2-oxoglutarate dehydrogenase complex dihydrolipoamide dehydrogenase (E3) component